MCSSRLVRWEGSETGGGAWKAGPVEQEEVELVAGSGRLRPREAGYTDREKAGVGDR